jgi:predicted  nucleic acid-binding Zn ribbon protein
MMHVTRIRTFYHIYILARAVFRPSQQRACDTCQLPVARA